MTDLLETGKITLTWSLPEPDPATDGFLLRGSPAIPSCTT